MLGKLSRFLFPFATFIALLLEASGDDLKQRIIERQWRAMGLTEDMFPYYRIYKQAKAKEWPYWNQKMVQGTGNLEPPDTSPSTGIILDWESKQGAKLRAEWIRTNGLKNSETKAEKSVFVVTYKEKFINSLNENAVIQSAYLLKFSQLSQNSQKMATLLPLFVKMEDMKQKAMKEAIIKASVEEHRELSRKVLEWKDGKTHWAEVLVDKENYLDGRKIKIGGKFGYYNERSHSIILNQDNKHSIRVLLNSLDKNDQVNVLKSELDDILAFEGKIIQAGSGDSIYFEATDVRWWNPSFYKIFYPAGGEFIKGAYVIEPDSERIE